MIELRTELDRLIWALFAAMARANGGQSANSTSAAIHADQLYEDLQKRTKTQH
jgi:hypothetical protein